MKRVYRIPWFKKSIYKHVFLKSQRTEMQKIKSFLYPDTAVDVRNSANIFILFSYIFIGKLRTNLGSLLVVLSKHFSSASSAVCRQALGDFIYTFSFSFSSSFKFLFNNITSSSIFNQNGNSNANLMIECYHFCCHFSISQKRVKDDTR